MRAPVLQTTGETADVVASSARRARLHTPLLSTCAALLAAAIAVVWGASCFAPSDPNEESLGEAEQAVDQQGDWTGFTNGQCVHGVYQFYLHRYGISLLGTCAQPGNVGNCENCGACMIWKSDIIHPDPSLFNQYAWGTTMPQTYDIVVYPPKTSAVGPGHVACVDHIESSDPNEWQQLYVMDTNYVGYEQMATEVHTVSRAPYGIFRLKSLDGCDRTNGELTFSCDGENDGLQCASVDDPEVGGSWADDFLCSKHDLGMAWSASGPIDGMDCTNVSETAGATAAAWADDYVCVPHQTPFAFSWSMSGPIEGQSCVQWNEPTAESFNDNFLCTTPVSVFSNAGFTFSAAGPVDGKVCVSVDEPGDTDTWNDNYFCSDTDLGMKWSHESPIAGMDCVHVTEAADATPDAWDDNYLCVPPGSSEKLTWSSAGPVAGKNCVRWFDHAESDTWWDNWMCADPHDPPTTTTTTTSTAATGGDTSRSGAAQGAGGGDSLDAPSSGCSTSARDVSGAGGSLGVAFGLAVASIRRRRRRA